MERNRFVQRLAAGGLSFLLLVGLVVAAGVWLLYPAEKKDAAEEEVKSVMAPLPTPLPTPVISSGGLRREQEKGLEDTAEAEPVVEIAPEAEALPLYFIWPVTGVLERRYDENTLSYDTTMADWRTHKGWDIAAGLGGHVLSTADGTVSAIYQDPLYGTTVEIDHGQGVVSVYANLGAEPTVSVGQSVQVGDVIGAVGESAICEVGEAYHLHFAMKHNGVSADPAKWLPER